MAVCCFSVFFNALDFFSHIWCWCSQKNAELDKKNQNIISSATLFSCCVPFHIKICFHFSIHTSLSCAFFFYSFVYVYFANFSMNSSIKGWRGKIYAVHWKSGNDKYLFENFCWYNKIDSLHSLDYNWVIYMTYFLQPYIHGYVWILNASSHYITLHISCMYAWHIVTWHTIKNILDFPTKHIHE